MEPRVYFLYLSHLLYGICVNIFMMNRYISKSYTRSKNTIYSLYRAEAAVVSTITTCYVIELKTGYFIADTPERMLMPIVFLFSSSHSILLRLEVSIFEVK